MLSTLRMFSSTLPTFILQFKEEKLVIFARDVTKAFIQSLLSKRLIMYKPPQKSFEAYLQIIDQVLRGPVQIHGEAEAGLYWHITVVPWLIESIPDIQQSIFDPSLIFSPTKMLSILLCTDDTLVITPESMLTAKAVIEKRLECLARQFLPMYFKGVGVIQDGLDILLSQIAYMNTKDKTQEPPET